MEDEIKFTDAATARANLKRKRNEIDEDWIRDFWDELDAYFKKDGPLTPYSSCVIFIRDGRYNDVVKQLNHFSSLVPNNGKWKENLDVVLKSTPDINHEICCKLLLKNPYWGTFESPAEEAEGYVAQYIREVRGSRFIQLKLSRIHVAKRINAFLDEPFYETQSFCFDPKKNPYMCIAANDIAEQLSQTHKITRTVSTISEEDNAAGGQTICTEIVVNIAPPEEANATSGQPIYTEIVTEYF